MKKRGQVTIFLMMGLVILILGIIFFYMGKSNVEPKVGTSIEKSSKPSDSDIVKAYAEACIKNAAETGLFKRIGLQGGYINPVKQDDYGEDGIKNSPFSPDDSSLFQGKKIPYYLQAKCDKYCGTCSPLPCTPPAPGCSIPRSSCPDSDCVQWRCKKWTYLEFTLRPDLELMEKKLSRYVEAEFEKCLDENVFGNVGVHIAKIDPKPKADVSFNAEDTSITVNQSITVKTKDSTVKLETFRADIPLRVKAMYENSILLISKIQDAIKASSDSPDSTEFEYSIVPDCAAYDKYGATNVYVKPSDDGSSRIVQFVDFSTYSEEYYKNYKYYHHSYIFQFALKNIDITDNCAG